MKRLLGIVLMLVFGIPAWAQQQQQPFVRSVIFNASESSPCYRMTDNGVLEHMLIWRTVGTVSGGTIKLSGYTSVDCSGSATDIIAATAWTSSGNSSITKSAAASVRITGESYAGSGFVVGTYIGYIPLVITPVDVNGAAFAPITDDCDGVEATAERYVSVGTSEDENEYSAAAATLCRIEISNAHATAGAWVKCTNLTATNTTPGTSAITWDFYAAPNSTSGNNRIHRVFSTAITCYIVLGKTAAAVDEVAADDIHLTLYYVN